MLKIVLKTLSTICILNVHFFLHLIVFYTNESPKWDMCIEMQAVESIDLYAISKRQLYFLASEGMLIALAGECILSE